MLVTPAPEPRARIIEKTADFTLDASYCGATILLPLTADITIAFASAAVLGEGFFCELRNQSTDSWAALSATIDGVSGGFPCMSGEHRQIYVTGGAVKSSVLRAFSWVYGFSYSFTMPSGYQRFDGWLIGTGGAGGRIVSATGAAPSGAGGACHPLNCPTPAAGTVVSFSVGSGAAGRITEGTGAAGNPTTLSWAGFSISAFGGGGGAYSLAGTCTSGGGGGALSAGGQGNVSPTIASGGLPGAVNTASPTGHGLGGASSSASFTLVCAAAFGGASAGAVSPSSIATSGSSIFGGPAGGNANSSTTGAGGTCAQRPGVAGGAGGLGSSAGSGVGAGAGGGGCVSSNAAHSSGGSAVGEIWLTARF